MNVRKSRTRRTRALTAMVLSFAGAQAGAQRVDLAAAKGWTAINRNVAVVDSGGRTILRLNEAAGVGLIWTPTIDFANGDIELDVRGRDVFQKSFVGITFRMAADTVFDLVYLRPFNFNSTDSMRHAHAVQYTSYPGYPWERLRVDHPGAYEAAVSPAPDPNGWVHVRLELRGSDLQVFIDHGTTPSLHVSTLGGRTHGGIGLWVGDLSPGDFANLTVHPRE